MIESLVEKLDDLKELLPEIRKGRGNVEWPGGGWND